MLRAKCKCLSQNIRSYVTEAVRQYLTGKQLRSYTKLVCFIRDENYNFCTFDLLKSLFELKSLLFNRDCNYTRLLYGVEREDVSTTLRKLISNFI